MRMPDEAELEKRERERLERERNAKPTPPRPQTPSERYAELAAYPTNYRHSLDDMPGRATVDMTLPHSLPPVPHYNSRLVLVLMVVAVVVLVAVWSRIGV